MSIDPANHGWDSQLEGDLPDTRLRAIEREGKRIIKAQMAWDPLYCGNCGQQFGWVTADAPFAFFLCDGCDSLSTITGMVKTEEPIGGRRL